MKVLIIGFFFLLGTFMDANSCYAMEYAIKKVKPRKHFIHRHYSSKTSFQKYDLCLEVLPTPSQKFSTADISSFFGNGYFNQLSIPCINNNFETFECSQKLINEGIQPYLIKPHVRLKGLSKKQLDNLMNGYQEWGISKILLLRGDSKFVNRKSGLIVAEEENKDEPVSSNPLDHISSLSKRFDVSGTFYPEGHVGFESDRINNALKKLDLGCKKLVSQAVYNHLALQGAPFQDKSKVSITIMMATKTSFVRKFAKENGISLPLEALEAFDAGNGIAYLGKLTQMLHDMGFHSFTIASLNKLETVSNYLKAL